ncbi:hypothetical protein [Mycobacteroides abscessus]|uniref:hypothetical protein n=1 Tax=Mycobacteroides abscessus TaxID=36809 RepID=UPI00092A6D1F|nr:hypothetical protein [Mycobacteroides abscessus]SIN36688.1 Uncharacterised protein [Mycobacteroides abscessus subsp. abscessus]
MIIEYAVELDVETVEGDADPAAAYSRALDLVSRWVRPAYGDSAAPSGSELADSSGSLVDGRGRNITWRSVASPSAHASEVIVRQPLDGSSVAHFVTEVAVLREADGARVRIDMGRDTGGAILPTSVAQLRRPGILRLLVSNPDLRVTRTGQHVTGKPINVGPDEVDSLWPLIDSAARLPLFLIDAGGGAAVKVGYQVASELAGLVSVIQIDRELRGPANAALRGRTRSDIPFSGGLLIYPDPPNPHAVPITGAEIRAGWRDPDPQAHNELVQILLRTVAPLSVAATGPNTLYQRAVRARAADELAARQRELEARQDQVRDAASDSEAVDALNALATELRSENASLKAEADEYARMYDEVVAQGKADLAQLREENAQLRREKWKPSATTEVAEQSPADAPDLPLGDLVPLAEFLTGATDGALVFTPAAHRAWKDSPYPFPDKMRDGLVDLAEAALAYRKAGGAVGARFNEWYYQRWQTPMSMLDEALTRLKLRYFEFQGSTYDRTPHLKLDDNTSADRVGRVYFAIDGDCEGGQRFIVDHVGTKLY